MIYSLASVATKLYCTIVLGKCCCSISKWSAVLLIFVWTEQFAEFCFQNGSVLHTSHQDCIERKQASISITSGFKERKISLSLQLSLYSVLQASLFHVWIKALLVVIGSCGTWGTEFSIFSINISLEKTSISDCDIELRDDTLHQYTCLSFTFLAISFNLVAPCIRKVGRTLFYVSILVQSSISYCFIENHRTILVLLPAFNKSEPKTLWSKTKAHEDRFYISCQSLHSSQWTPGCHSSVKIVPYAKYYYVYDKENFLFDVKKLKPLNTVRIQHLTEMLKNASQLKTSCPCEFYSAAITQIRHL